MNVAQFIFLMWAKVFQLLVDDSKEVLAVN